VTQSYAVGGTRVHRYKAQQDDAAHRCHVALIGCRLHEELFGHVDLNKSIPSDARTGAYRWWIFTHPSRSHEHFRVTPSPFRETTGAIGLSNTTVLPLLTLNT
jgi:hypothetical protein